MMIKLPPLSWGHVLPHPGRGTIEDSEVGLVDSLSIQESFKVRKCLSFLGIKHIFI
jgi:hypothetical protein